MSGFGTFLSLTATGLTMGMIYACLGVGLILLLRAVGVLNFAQGDFLALGAYAGWAITTQLHITGIGMVILLAVFLALFGIFFMFTCYWPLRNSKWPQALMICTLGASTVIAEICPLLCGSTAKTMEPNVTGSITLGEFSLQNQYVLVFAFCLLGLTFVWILFDKIYAGKVMAAAAQNKYAAELIGIPTILTTMCTYILVLLVAGFAGYLLSPIYMVRTSLKNFQSKAFTGVILGGTGSIMGCVIGSLIMGLVESYSTYFTTLYKDVFVFGVLLVILLIKPSGLFKSSIGVQEKA